MNNNHECLFVEEQEPNGRLIIGPCIECELPAAEAINIARKKIEALKTDNERFLWNLAGCSTYALGCDISEGHNKEMALPALEDVLKLAINFDLAIKGLEDVVMHLEGSTCECGIDLHDIDAADSARTTLEKIRGSH